MSGPTEATVWLRRPPRASRPSCMIMIEPGRVRRAVPAAIVAAGGWKTSSGWPNVPETTWRPAFSTVWSTQGQWHSHGGRYSAGTIPETRCRHVLGPAHLVALAGLVQVAGERVVEAVVSQHVALVHDPPGGRREAFGAPTDLEERRVHALGGEDVEQPARPGLVRAVVEAQGDDLLGRGGPGSAHRRTRLEAGVSVRRVPRTLAPRVRAVGNEPQNCVRGAKPAQYASPTARPAPSTVPPARRPPHPSTLGPRRPGPDAGRGRVPDRAKDACQAAGDAPTGPQRAQRSSGSCQGAETGFAGGLRPGR